VGGLWVRLGKIKCAAKALASLSACSSFNFMKRWGFVCLFTAGFLSVVSSFRVRHNGHYVGDVADLLKTNLSTDKK